MLNFLGSAFIYSLCRAGIKNGALPQCCAMKSLSFGCRLLFMWGSWGCTGSCWCFSVCRLYTLEGRAAYAKRVSLNCFCDIRISHLWLSAGKLLPQGSVALARFSRTRENRKERILFLSLFLKKVSSFHSGSGSRLPVSNLQPMSSKIHGCQSETRLFTAPLEKCTFYWWMYLKLKWWFKAEHWSKRGGHHARAAYGAQRGALLSRTRNSNEIHLG